MPRRPRCADANFAYHVLNRAVGQARLFDKSGDYIAFERVLGEAQGWQSMRLLAYCVMPNHWHLVLWPERDGDLSEYLRWLTVTHTQRWHAHRGTAGTGPIYQGRFKSFPIQEDEHLLTVCRYVERNPLRARLVSRAEAWPWSSLYRRLHGGGPPLASWPMAEPPGWLDIVNRPETEAELQAMRRSVVRGSPLGDEAWRRDTAERLGLQATLRPLGRPRRERSPLRHPMSDPPPFGDP
jgi:putative transposase